MNNYTEFYKIEFNKTDLKINEKRRRIRIDYIRNLFSNIIENPVMGKYKIFCIKYAENMNVNAQNALLKILEEPPKYALIFLLSENIDSLLPTIKSRCTKLYVFDNESNFCKLIKEDFESSDSVFNLFFRDIVNLNKYAFYDKYKKLFTRENYKENIIILEESLSCFLNEDKKYYKLHEIFIETSKRLERNANFEMLVDYFLLNSWDIINK